MADHFNKQSYKIEWIGHSMLIHAKVFRVKFHNNKDIYDSLINPKHVEINQIRLYLFLINEERKYSNISKSPVWTLFNTILDNAVDDSDIDPYYLTFNEIIPGVNGQGTNFFTYKFKIF